MGSNGTEWYKWYKDGGRWWQIVATSTEWSWMVPNGVPNHAEWYQIVPNDTKWCTMILNSTEWRQIVTNDGECIECCWIVPNGVEWCWMILMVQNVAEWYRIKMQGTKWYKMVLNGTKWYKMVRNCTKRFQMVHNANKYWIVPNCARWYRMMKLYVSCHYEWKCFETCYMLLVKYLFKNSALALLLYVS